MNTCQNSVVCRFSKEGEELRSLLAESFRFFLRRELESNGLGSMRAQTSKVSRG